MKRFGIFCKLIVLLFYHLRLLTENESSKYLTMGNICGLLLNSWQQ